jgi:hypothetical protein
VTDLATLRIVVDSSGAIRAVDGFGNSVEGAAKKATTLEQSAKRMGLALGGAAVAGLTLFIRETAEAQREQAQLAAALRSTAGASGQTIASLNDHADALRKVTAATGGEIAAAQAMLLTFTKVSGETFPRATATVLDMAHALGTDARGAALQLGKALNDPVLGVTALARAGVQFSASQKAVIENLVETNRLAEAQALILKELETQVGGSAAAYRNTLGGALAAVKESFMDLFEVGNSDGMNSLVEGLNRLADGMGLIRVRVLQASASLDKFFADHNIAFLENISKFSGGVLGHDGFGSGFDLETQLTRRGAAEQRLRDLAREEAALVRAVNEGVRLRLSLRDGPLGAGSSQTPGSARPITITATTPNGSRNWRDVPFAQLPNNAWTDLVAAARWRALFEDGMREATAEVARVFQEQMQLSVARFATDFLSGGFGSLGAFWDSFKQLGREALGNLFARAVTPVLNRGVDAATARLGTGGLVGLGAVGFILSGLSAAADRARQLAEAFAAVQRSIKDFAAAATDTPEQAALRQLQNTRDDLARQAVAASGIRGFTGGYAEAYDVLQLLVGPFAGKAGALRDALDALGAAFDANVAAAEEAARATNLVTLTRFRDSLALSGQSPLSPTQQLAEARRQYDAILGLARGGDQSAVDSLPETARTLLEASRAVFASGGRYADEFARVTADVNAIIEALTPTQDVQEAQLEVMQEVGRQTIDRLDTLIERIERVGATLRSGVIVEGLS